MASAFEIRRIDWERLEWARSRRDLSWPMLSKKRSTNAANTDSY
jgi:hypothetical protein